MTSVVPSMQDLKIHVGSFTRGPLNFPFRSSRGLYLIRGRNGSGKTTLLRTLLGRLKPAAGHFQSIPEPIGAVGVEGFLFLAWTVEENRKWFEKLFGRPLKIFPKGEAIYEELKHAKVKTLSAGQRRQVELTIALSLPCPTLFLDEPFNPLDRELRQLFAHEISVASKSQLILITTHQEADLTTSPDEIWELDL